MWADLLWFEPWTCEHTRYRSPPPCSDGCRFWFDHHPGVDNDWCCKMRLIFTRGWENGAQRDAKITSNNGLTVLCCSDVVTRLGDYCEFMCVCVCVEIVQLAGELWSEAAFVENTESKNSSVTVSPFEDRMTKTNVSSVIKVSKVCFAALQAVFCASAARTHPFSSETCPQSSEELAPFFLIRYSQRINPNDVLDPLQVDTCSIKWRRVFMFPSGGIALQLPVQIEFFRFFYLLKSPLASATNHANKPS